MTRDRPTSASDTGQPGRAPDAALAGRYGAQDVYVVWPTSLSWQILDVTLTGVVIVETLAGFDDRLEQARALARDYVREKRTTTAGAASTIRCRTERPASRCLTAENETSIGR
jgi:hypothetical protein